jgi:hypothetical protein
VSGCVSGCVSDRMVYFLLVHFKNFTYFMKNENQCRHFRIKIQGDIQGTYLIIRIYHNKFIELFVVDFCILRF